LPKNPRKPIIFMNTFTPWCRVWFRGPAHDVELGGTDPNLNLFMGRIAPKRFWSWSASSPDTPILEGLTEYINDQKPGITRCLLAIPREIVRVKPVYSRWTDIRYFELVTQVHLRKYASWKRSVGRLSSPRDLKNELCVKLSVNYQAKERLIH
jgi:hypothetical protein